MSLINKQKLLNPVDLSASTLTASIELSGGTVELKATEYLPNHMPFEGVLALLDVPSSGPPHGLPKELEGRPILLPSDVAAECTESFVGMGVNIKDSLDGHNKKQKVGVILAAWIKAGQLRVSGIIYDRDFPEEAATIQTHKAELGMSFETTQTVMASGDYNGIPVALISSLVGTGATILRKVSAAYRGTSLAANLTEEMKVKMEEMLKAMQIAMADLAAKMADVVKSTGESGTAIGAKMVDMSAQLTKLEEKVVAVDAKVEDKVTTLSAALETVPKEGLKLEDISTSIKEIVKAELEAAKRPPVVPVRKTAPLARYGDVTGKDLEAAIHKSEGTTTEKLTALILAGMAQEQVE